MGADFVRQCTKSFGGLASRHHVASVRAMDDDRRPSRLAQLNRLDDGWALTAEFISAVLTWTFLGWLADRWLGTDPWLVALGAVLGFAAGMYLAWLRHIRPADD